MNGSQPMKAVVGQHVRPRREVLAAAEADFEVERAGAPEQALGGDRTFRRNRNLRQQRVDQRLLPGAQRLAFRAAVKPVERRRIAGLVRGHARCANENPPRGKAPGR
jgi:hypothetical protein